MSGKDGSVGYSFFSGAGDTRISLNFVLSGEEVESEADDGDLFPGDGERGGESEFEVAVDTLRLRSAKEASVVRSSSREDFIS